MTEAAPPAPVEPAAKPQSAQVSIAETFVIPADSVIGLEIEHSVSSETAQPEDRVDARVARDVKVDGAVVIPAGSRVRGEVTRVENGGRFKDRGRIEIRFHTLVLADGDTQAIATDTLFREGENVGRKTGARIGATAAGGAIIGAIFGGEKGAAIGAAAGAGAGTAVTAAQKPSEARFRAGSVVTVRLTAPVSITVQRVTPKLERQSRSSFAADPRTLYSIMRHAILPALLLGALVSAPAAAQTTLTPFTGVTFGGETTENRYVYGAVLGFGSGAGVDIDFGFAPNFFGSDDPFGDLDGKLNITTLMFNVRFGGGKPQGVSPYRLGWRRPDARLGDQPGRCVRRRHAQRLRAERRRRPDRLLQRPRRAARRHPLLPQPAGRAGRRRHHHRPARLRPRRLRLLARHGRPVPALLACW